MVKCPSCGKDVPVFKEWNYGPRDARGAQLRVKLYHCQCGAVFREYISKKTGKITLAKKLYAKRKSSLR
jgi:uncharacterized Zn finger protein